MKATCGLSMGVEDDEDEKNSAQLNAFLVDLRVFAKIATYLVCEYSIMCECNSD